MFYYNLEPIYGKSQLLKTANLRIKVAAEGFELHLDTTKVACIL